MTEEEVKALQEEVTKLKQEQESLGNELSAKRGRVEELEETMAARDAETTVLRKSVTLLEAKLANANNALNQAVAGYRTLAVQVNSEMPEEMITGDTIEAVDNAVASARRLVSKVKDKMETVKTQFRIPAGAPRRAAADLSAMSAREKIRYGIGGKNNK